MIQKSLIALVSGCIFLFYPQFLSLNNKWALSDSMNHHNSSHDHNHNQDNGNIEHGHKMIPIPDNQPIPKVNLIIHKDAISGWNLEIDLTNFKFTPEKVNLDNNYNEGHAHLYINNKKITRIYSNWYYLPELEPGVNEIKVSLNTDQHNFLTYNGKMIEDVEIITVNE